MDAPCFNKSTIFFCSVISYHNNHNSQFFFEFLKRKKWSAVDRDKNAYEASSSFTSARHSHTLKVYCYFVKGLTKCCQIPECTTSPGKTLSFYLPNISFKKRPRSNPKCIACKMSGKRKKFSWYCRLLWHC